MPLSPLRIQRKRTKGWKTPPNTVYVGRPGPWGNRFSDYPGRSVEKSIQMFRHWLENVMRRYRPNAAPQYRGLNIGELKGKNLSCWCKLCDRHKDGKPLDEDCADCQPCHVDVLGKAANLT